MEAEDLLPFHKSPCLIPILSQIHPVRTFTPYFFKMLRVPPALFF